MNLLLSFKRQVALCATLTILLASIQVAAQYKDDPNRDQIPHYLRESARGNTDLPLSTVMTINNYDNFNLGVDFGEGNIAESNQIPGWYSTASATFFMRTCTDLPLPASR